MATLADTVVFLKETIYFQFSWKQFVPRYVLLAVCYLVWSGMPVHNFFLDFSLLFVIMMPILAYTTLAADYFVIELLAFVGNRLLTLIGRPPQIQAEVLPLWSNETDKVAKAK